MGDYRAYILGIDGHRFIRVENFLRDHSSDAAAIEAAKKLTDKHVVEVWDCGRLVAELKPEEESLAPELAPSLIFAPPSDLGKPKEPISLTKVSELASDAPSLNPG